MKQLLAIFLLGFLTVNALGQPSLDVGVFGGVGTYFGDMTKVDFQKSINPAYGGFVRYNFNPRYGLRFNVLNGSIGADGEFESNPFTFKKDVLDISIQFEFNYLKYIVGDKITPWSTYLFGGIGMQLYKYENRKTELASFVDPSYFANDRSYGSIKTPTIPFGLGFKFNLSKRFGIGYELGFRKTFSDKLDDLDDPLSYTNADDIVVKYTDQFHNNDWTSYMGVHLVYKLIYGTKEWELKTPKKKMLDWGIWNKNRKE